MRRHQSTSSLNMKYASSIPPTWATAARLGEATVHRPRVAEVPARAHESRPRRLPLDQLRRSVVRIVVDDHALPLEPGSFLRARARADRERAQAGEDVLLRAVGDDDD